MDTSLHKHAVRILLIRLCISLAIVGSGFVYPAWQMKYDQDISTPVGQVDLRAARVPRVSLCIGLVYACMAAWRYAFNSKE